MSEEAKDDPEALFKEFGDKEAEAAPDASQDRPGAEGQDEGGTPDKGQAETVSPGEDADKQPPASEAPANDLWKDAPEPLRKAYEESEAARQKAENHAKAQGGRLAQAYQERDALRTQLDEAGKAAGPGTEQGDEESFEDYRKRMTEDYPEFARLFDTLDAATSKVGKLETSVETATATAAATQTEEALAEQERVFNQAHPNWEAEKKDPETLKALIEWAEGQPPYVQDALRRNAETITDGQSAADLIARFKRETADPERDERNRRRAEQMEGGRDTRVSGPGATKTGAAEGDTEGLWNEFRAADERKAVTGGNRR